MIAEIEGLMVARLACDPGWEVGLPGWHSDHSRKWDSDWIRLFRRSSEVAHPSLGGFAILRRNLLYLEKQNKVFFAILRHYSDVKTPVVRSFFSSTN